MDNVIVETFGRLNHAITITPVSITGKNLPLLVQENYNFLDAQFRDGRAPVLLAQVKTKREVIQLEKHWMLIEKAAIKPVILILEKLSTREKERLIKRGVPFIVPGRFIHAQILGISGEVPTWPKRYEELLMRETLSPWAETLLIKQLLDESIHGKGGSEIAEAFGVTPIVISQAIRELEFHGLCDHVRAGKQKLIEFETIKNLWWKSLRILKNPVVGTVTIGEPPTDLIRAGETALAHYSMLADRREQIFAISKSEFLKLKRRGVITLKMLAEEKHQLQLWRRDPRTLAVDGFADRVSVYCALRDSTDARVQQEFTRMMHEINLEVPDESR